MILPLLPGDPVWVVVHGGERKALFLRYDGNVRCKVQTGSGAVRGAKVTDVRYRSEG